MILIDTKFKKGNHYSIKTEFKKGSVPFNKGKKGLQVSTRKGLKLNPLSKEHKDKISLSMCKKENHPNWKGGKPKCLDCGKELSNYNNKRCSNHRGLKGTKSPHWIEDRTQLAKRQERNDMAYKEWKRQVWIRDNYKCKMRNCDCKGKIIAHHILGWSFFPELRYEVNNGITLCQFHHPLKRNDEKKLSPYFQELVGVKVN